MAWEKELSLSAELYGQAGSGATTILKTPVIDMVDAESVLFLGAATVTSTAQWLKFRMSTASASGGMSDATGQVDHTATGLLYLDVHRPIKRFVQGIFTASGASSPARFVGAVKYGMRSQPSTQPAGTTGLRVYSPGSGTATG